MAYSQQLMVDDHTGLRSFHELHPVLGCGRLTACACGMDYAALTGLGYFRAHRHNGRVQANHKKKRAITR